MPLEDPQIARLRNRMLGSRRRVIRVGQAFGELDLQQLGVLPRVQRKLVVGDDARATLRFREARKANGRDSPHSELASGQNPAVTSDHPALGIYCRRFGRFERQNGSSRCARRGLMRRFPAIRRQDRARLDLLFEDYQSVAVALARARAQALWTGKSQVVCTGE